MTGIDIILLVAILLILMVLVVLAIAETGLNRISAIKAQTLDENAGSKATRSLVGLVEHPERFINPLLVTVTVLQTAQAFLTTILADRLFGAWGVLGAFVVNVIVFFVLAESMPKTWAIQHAERAGLATARPMAWLVAFPPLRLVSRGLIGLTNVLLPGKGLKQGPFVSEQELLGIVEAAAEDEVIEHEERQLIESIIEFGDTVAREVMIPRPDMVIIPHESSVSAALDLAIANGYSRLPVFGPDDSDITGLAYTKDLIRAEREGRGDMSVLDLVRPVRFIPENKPVSRLMREMQAGKFHLAIVADEYGDVAGLVTLEDCLEELVGEIVDEYDTEELSAELLPDGEYMLDGGMSIDEVNELLDGALPNEDWDTIGGLVFSTLGHVPRNGEELEFDGWHLTAHEVVGRRVRRVKIGRTADAEPAAPAHSAEPVDDSADDSATSRP